jgi:hypothetical protein
VVLDLGTCSVVDPDSLQKWKKKIQLKKISFLIKIAAYFSLGLLKGLRSYRRSLQPSKENIQHFK